MAKIWRATYRADLHGIEMLTGLHYQFDGDTGSDEPDAHSVADKIDSHLTSAFQACVPTSGTVVNLHVREELAPGSTDVPDEYVKSLNVAGTLFGSDNGTAPEEMVALVHRKASAAVRGAKSWCFMPSIFSSGAVVNGLWQTTSTPYGAWNAFAGLLDDDLNYAGPIPGVQGNLHPVAYSRTRRARLQTPYTFIITSADVSTKPRWLRSRAT